jgi:hypothetical protein
MESVLYAMPDILASRVKFSARFWMFNLSAIQCYSQQKQFPEFLVLNRDYHIIPNPTPTRKRIATRRLERNCPSPRRLPGDSGGTSPSEHLPASAAASFLAPIPPHLRPSSWWRGGGGWVGAAIHLLVDRVLNRVHLGSGFARRWCSAVELGSAGGAWLLCGLFPGGAGDAETTAWQRNNFSQFLPFSDSDIYTPMSTERLGRSVEESRADTSSSLSGDDVVLPVNLDEDDPWWKFELCSGCRWWMRRCIVGTWEIVYSAYSPCSKPSPAASTSWKLALVPSDDWGAASAAVTNGSLKVSRKMNRSFGLLCNFHFILGYVYKRTGVIL